MSERERAIKRKKKKERERGERDIGTGVPSRNAIIKIKVEDG